jgi:glyoxylase I family protein
MSSTTTLVVGSVHHVSFRVDDLDESLEFYVGTLGLAQLPRPELSVRGAWLQSGATQVHLIEAAASDAVGHAPGELTNLACHIAFHVDDLEVAEQSLRDHGYEFFRGNEVEQLVLRDPSGNIIELTPYGS